MSETTRILLDFEGDRRDVHAYEQAGGVHGAGDSIGHVGHRLEVRGTHLVLGDRRLEVEESFDIAAHETESLRVARLDRIAISSILT